MMSANLSLRNTARIFDDAFRAKTSEGVRNFFAANPQAREACAERARAHVHTPETRAKIGLISKAVWAANPSRKIKAARALAERNKAVVWTEEKRRKMSETKKRFYDEHPEIKERLAEVGRKQVRSAATKEKISRGLRDAYAFGRRGSP